jgi:hypothetical protein
VADVQVVVSRRPYSVALPLPALAVLHAGPDAAPTGEALRHLVVAAWVEDCSPVLVMATSTRDAIAASLRDVLGFPTAPDCTSCYGAPIELDDAVTPGTVLAYRWDEWAIIRSLREDYPQAAVYPTPPTLEAGRG